MSKVSELTQQLEETPVGDRFVDGRGRTWTKTDQGRWGSPMIAHWHTSRDLAVRQIGIEYEQDTADIGPLRGVAEKLREREDARLLTPSLGELVQLAEVLHGSPWAGSRMVTVLQRIDERIRHVEPTG